MAPASHPVMIVGRCYPYTDSNGAPPAVHRGPNLNHRANLRNGDKLEPGRHETP